MKTQVSKEALLHYFAGQATALQKQQLDEWAKDEENQEFFFECLARWESQHTQFSADANKALERHQIRMTNQVSVSATEPVRFTFLHIFLVWMACSGYNKYCITVHRGVF